jgi:hypothetical protein
MSATTSPKETLHSNAQRWSAALRASAQGPLLIAPSVLAVAEAWPSYRHEADGRDCTTWLLATLGKNLVWFRCRAAAVHKLGPWSAKMLHHDVALWVAGKVGSNQEIDLVKFALMKATKEWATGACLSLGQARPVVAKALGLKPVAKKGCSRCAELEAKLRRLGEKV